MKTLIALLMNVLLCSSLTIAEPTVITDPDRSATVVEIALFSAKPGVTADAIIHASKAMKTTITGWQGFIKRELVDLGQGQWVDIVHWRDMDAAKRAEKNAMQSSSCLSFFALLDEKQGRLLHGYSRLLQSPEL